MFATNGREMEQAVRNKNTLTVLQPIFDIIEQYLRWTNVMIHCRAGVHRAGTMGVILVMKFLSLNLKDAMRHVRSKRRATNVIGWHLTIAHQVASELEGSTIPAAPAAPIAGLVTKAAAPAPRLPPKAATPVAGTTAKSAPTSPARAAHLSGAPAAAETPASPGPPVALILTTNIKRPLICNHYY